MLYFIDHLREHPLDKVLETLDANEPAGLLEDSGKRPCRILFETIEDETQPAFCDRAFTVDDIEEDPLVAALLRRLRECH